MRFSMCWLSLVLAGWLAMASVSRADLVYISGHADLGVGFELGNLHLHIHAEEPLTLFGGGTVPAGEIDPADLIIGVPGPSIGRPAGAAGTFWQQTLGIKFGFCHKVPIRTNLFWALVRKNSCRQMAGPRR